MSGSDTAGVRCRGCGALLATVDRGGHAATLRRGDYVAEVEGDSRITLHCYRRFCGVATTFHLTRALGRQPEAAARQPDGAGADGKPMV